MKPKFSVSSLSIKRIAIILAVFILILLLTVITFLHFYFHENRLKRMVIPKLEAYLGREVKIDDIGLKFFPAFGLQIDNLRIINQPGFEYKFLTQFDQFRLNLALLPLLRKEIEVSEIILDHPVFNLEQKKEETNYNFLAGLTAPKEEKSDKQAVNKDKKAKVSGLNINLASLSVSGGEVNYINHDQQQKFNLTGIGFDSAVELAAGHLTTSGEFSIGGVKFLDPTRENLVLNQLDFLLKHQLTVDLKDRQANFKQLNLVMGKFNLESQFDLLWTADQLKIIQFTGQSGSSKVDLEAAISHFEDPELDFSLDSQLKLAELVADLPVNPGLDLAGTIKLDLQGERVKAFVPTTDNQITGQIKINKLVSSGPTLPLNLDELSMLVTVKKDRLIADKMTVKSLDSVLSGNLKINNWQKLLLSLSKLKPKLPGEVKLTLNSNRLDLDQIISKTANAEPKNKKQEQPQKGELYLPYLDLEIGMNLKQIKYQGNQYSVVSNLQSQAGKLKVKNLAVEGLDSKVDLTGEADYKQVSQSQDIADLAVDFNTQADLNLSTVQKELFNVLSVTELADWNFSGRLTTKLTAQFLLADLFAGAEGDYDKLDLKGQLAVTEGELVGKELLTKGGKVNLDLTVNNRNLEVKSFALAGLESDLAGRILVADWPNLIAALTDRKTEANSKIKFDLKADQITGNKILSATGGSKQETKKQLKSKPKTSSLQLLDQINIDGNLKVANFNFAELAAENLDLSLQVKDQIAEINQLRFNYAGGNFTGQTKANLTDKLTYSGNFKAKQVEVNQVLSQFTSFKDHLFGKMNWQGNFSGQRLNLETVNLTSKAQIKNGELKSWIVVDKWNKKLNFFDEESLKFRDLTGKVQINDGKLMLKDFAAETEHGQVKLEGYSTLAGGLNYQLDYLLAKKAAQKLKYRRFYPTSDGQIRLDFKLTGEVTEPQFSWQQPDIKSKLKKEKEKAKDKAEQKKDKAKEKIEQKKEKIKEDIKDKVKDLF